jgi:hypothetical protein
MHIAAVPRKIQDKLPFGFITQLSSSKVLKKLIA